MTRRQRTLYRLGRACRLLATTLVVAAGVYYLLAPPNTTTAFFNASWPPMAWGAIFLAGGVVTAAGIRSRVLQVEHLGMLMIVVGSGMLALAQTLVMVEHPVTHTRGGGVLILWALTAFATARYFDLSADIRSAKLAQTMKG